MGLGLALVHVAPRWRCMSLLWWFERLAGALAPSSSARVMTYSAMRLVLALTGVQGRIRSLLSTNFELYFTCTFASHSLTF
eukprot:3612027-Pleurochrysis_carterae.AAC.1